MKLRCAGWTQSWREFPRETSAVADALTSCDLTTNSVGMPVSFEERLADIFRRYDEAFIVAQAITQAQPALARVVERVQRDGPQEYIDSVHAPRIVSQEKGTRYASRQADQCASCPARPVCRSRDRCHHQHGWGLAGRDLSTAPRGDQESRPVCGRRIHVEIALQTRRSPRLVP